MPEPKSSKPFELTYPLRAAARLTGLSPSVLRAWERRHRVVEPQRTPGGTRRYSAADLERLRLVKAAVDAGHRIGQVAQLDLTELERWIAGSTGRPGSEPEGRLDPILDALDRLDGVEARRLLALQLSALGPSPFARELVAPLLHEIGQRWARDRMRIASEHLASSVLRSMLGSALLPTAASLRGPRIVFATPSGERHELGLQIAALTALGAGANPIYLGADLPAEELLDAAERAGVAAIALSVVTLPAAQATRAIGAIRGGLSRKIRLWVGGAAAADLPLPDRVEYIDGLAALEQRVALLDFEPDAGGPR